MAQLVLQTLEVRQLIRELGSNGCATDWRPKAGKASARIGDVTVLEARRPGRSGLWKVTLRDGPGIVWEENESQQSS
jgi:hypothetical protein